MPAKVEKGICRNRGRRPSSCKRIKASLQERKKEPVFLQKDKSKFAGTEEGARVPAKG
ncbi:hypothetical protein QA612_04010 [Evansella sp. AB-P1]|uniref:hypothetical protein n=1 Tax=Evansella sp. AB-P1 TaxID=3037653 RepID=UPI00241FFD72|nr:hypothetical protein [Evansella sp. AB-P1]MDG5786644.1 hypothetical protein [Evansella sp. AB-P1]